jgi:hypothetical protein
MPITKPDSSEYFEYFQTYISKVPKNDVVAALAESGKQFSSFLKAIPEDKADYKYEPGKWCIKEVVNHVSDAERVFVYRALTFSRNDKAVLPGFDEELWVPESNAANRSFDSLIKEYENVRSATLSFYEGLTEEMSKRKGNANNHEISVRALGFIIAGHEMHHMRIIKERYLK